MHPEVFRALLHGSGDDVAQRRHDPGVLRESISAHRHQAHHSPRTNTREVRFILAKGGFPYEIARTHYGKWLLCLCTIRAPEDFDFALFDRVEEIGWVSLPVDEVTGAIVGSGHVLALVCGKSPKIARK